MNDRKEITTVEELDAEVTKQLRQDTSKVINGIFDDLVAVKKNNILPEEIFVKDFLPLFYGTIDDKDLRYRQIQYWISIAGSPSSEVSVVDNNNNVLFDVPAVMNSSSINVTDRGNIEIDKIFTNFSNDNFKIRGSRNLLLDLNDKQHNIVSNTDIPKKEAYERLNEIFKRYNLDIKLHKDNVNDDSNDDFEYE